MSDSGEISQHASTFSQALNAAARLPGVRIDRDVYLRTALQRYCTEDQIERAVATNPAAAGIPPATISVAAKTSIQYETTKVTALSTAAGLPGGIWLLGSVPADMAQYLGHMLRVAQKLAYLYSWPNLFVDGGGELDEATENILTLFVGVMFGVQSAQTGLSKVSAMIASQVVKKLPQRALTKGVIYPIVKKVASLVGVAMTKKTFASGLAKVIPVVGAGISGGLTLATFLPMSKRLKTHLATLELTKPSDEAIDTGIETPGEQVQVDAEQTGAEDPSEPS